jgi:hypothetical protein
MAHFKTVKVHIDCHVEVERHRYSVPHLLVGQTIEARIASHARNSRQGGFATTATHMPAAHLAHMEWTPTRLFHWGQSIGPATAEAVKRLMAENKECDAVVNYLASLPGWRATRLRKIVSLGLCGYLKRHSNFSKVPGLWTGRAFGHGSAIWR